MDVKYDHWLLHYFDDYLSEKDELCKNEANDFYDIFGDLNDSDLWTILFTKNYDCYPNIKKKLPDLPPEKIQLKYNGQKGFQLLKRAKESYERIKVNYLNYGQKELDQSNVLDFGVGWGRLIRFFAKDMPNQQLCGCDVADEILKVGQELRIPGVIRKSDEVPTSLPFDKKFDLVFSNSIFSHLSEDALNACFTSIGNSMNTGGIFCLTLWAPHFLFTNFRMKPLKVSFDQIQKSERFIFVPHKAGGTYGDAFISLKYISKNWNNDMFAVKKIQMQSSGLIQVMVVLEKK